MPMPRSNCLSGCDFAPQVKVVRGGKLKARKGVNVPDVEIDCAALTAKVCLAGWVSVQVRCDWMGRVESCSQNIPTFLGAVQSNCQDIEDAEFLLQLDPPIEYICVSFVQKGQDLQDIKIDSDSVYSSKDWEGNGGMIGLEVTNSLHDP